MVQFVDIILVSLAIITLNSFSTPICKTTLDHNEIEGFERIDTIYISDSQYNVVKKEGCGLFIQITDKTLLERLSVATSPILAILIDGSIIIARGNVITSSFIPDGADCFYPVNSSGKLLLYRDNIIHLLYVSKKHPQSILRKRRFREESWDHN